LGIRDIYAPIVRDSHTSFEIEPPSAEEMATRMNKAPGMPWLVCEGESGAVAGYAYAGRFRERLAYQWTAETSVYVHPSAHRRGMGRALYSGLHEVLRLLGFRRAVAGITLPNAASVALHERMGYTPVGVYHAVGFKLGKWRDVAWYELGLAPLIDDPAPPVELTGVRGTPACCAALDAATDLLSVRA
jgi:phosphinothricin acetyltransferase